MNDSMYEQLIPRKAALTDHLIRLLIVLAVAVLVILGVTVIGPAALTLAAAVALLAILFIFPRLKVEYEYILLNHEMQIDVIYNQSRRKTLAEFDLFKAEGIFPKKALSSQSFAAEKTYDFTSGPGSQDVYAILVNIRQQRACILIEPDETMKQHINNWAGSSIRQL